MENGAHLTENGKWSKVDEEEDETICPLTMTFEGRMLGGEHIGMEED